MHSLSLRHSNDAHPPCSDQQEVDVRYGDVAYHTEPGGGGVEGILEDPVPHNTTQGMHQSYDWIAYVYLGG